MLRQNIKRAIARSLTTVGAVRLGSRVAYRNLPLILAYHRVVENFAECASDAIPSMLISAAMFERHLEWVERRFRFASLDEIGDQLKCGQPFDQPVAAVTFDDGYRDIHDIAFPILKKKGIPAAVFVSTGIVSTARPHLHDIVYWLSKRDASAASNPKRDPQGVLKLIMETLPHASIASLAASREAEIEVTRPEWDQFRPLTWEMLRTMRRAGFTIGSHTRTHALLPNVTSSQMADETLVSRLALESNLGEPVRHFAYPNGFYNSAVLQEIGNAGYLFAYTTCGHRDPQYPLLTIPRKVLWEKSAVDRAGRFSPDVMGCLVSNVFDVMSRCNQRHRSIAA